MKEEIIRKIDDAILMEDSAIPIYSKHIKSTLFWSGLNDEFQKRIKETLDFLTEESQKHVFLLERVKKLLNERY
ncbi:hypothetical protein ACFL1R_06345 [Candidatus Latescibacterota bacterium]